MRALFLTAVLLAANAQAAAPEKTASAANDKKPDLVCTYERSVGSHIPKRVCTTAAQREEERRDSRTAAEQMHNRVTPSTTPAAIR